MHINWLGAALAFVVGMIVASVWYGQVFLATWSRLAGVTPEQSSAARTRNMTQLAIANAITAVGLTLAVAMTYTVFETRSVLMSLAVGFVAWLTLSATTLLQHNAFELKPAKLTILNAAYQLVLFLAMALVIAIT